MAEEVKHIHGVEEGLAFARHASAPAVIFVAKEDWATTLEEVVRLRARVDELLKANNALVERARAGRAGLSYQHAKLVQAADDLLGLAHKAKQGYRRCGP